MKALASLFLAAAMFSVAVYGQHDDSPPELGPVEKSEKTELLDEFGRLGDCDLRSRFDHFFARLMDKPTSTGYVLIYQGADVLPAYYDLPVMERVFRNQMAFRNFDANRVVVINGGFREEGRTQLWIVPAGGEVPEPTGTIERPEIPADKTFLYDEGGVEFEQSADGLTGFELPSVKADHEAAMADMEAELKREREANGEPVPDEEQTEEPEDPAESEEFVDDRTREEIEASRFNWVRGSFGELLGKREGSTGVMIFYADDQILDIARVREFIEEGKWRLATAANINADRITVQFGGYRHYPEIEYWVVPPKGSAPVAKPQERPVEEEDQEPGSN